MNNLRATLLPMLAITAGIAVGDTRNVYNESQLADALAARSPGDGHRDIIVYPGTYHITDPLPIFSDTTLTLKDGVTVIADFDTGAMLFGCHYDENGDHCWQENLCTHGGYGQTHDVVIDGGVWDRNSKASELSNVFIFRHASRITVKNATLKRSTNHILNFSGSSDVTAQNVTFVDPIKYTGTDRSFWGNRKVGDAERYRTMEAIHTDFLDDGEPGVSPQDGTACRNVRVENCLFDGVFSGIGVHHVPDSGRGKGLFVTNCEFRNLLSYAIFAFALDDVVAENNNVAGGAGLITALNATLTLNGNTVNNSKDHAIRSEDSSLLAYNNVIKNCAAHSMHIVGGTANISDNILTSPGDVGVRLSGKASATIERNTIESTGTHGISATESSSIKAYGNTISGSKGHGLIVSGSNTMAAAFDGNTIDRAGSSGVCVMDGGYVAMSGNTISSPVSYGVIATKGSSVKAAENTISYAGSHAFNISASSATIESNTATSPNGVGIKGDDKAKITAISNAISSCATYGMLMMGDSKLDARYNTITSTGSYGICLNGCASSTVSNNKISQSVRDGIRIVSVKGCVISRNTISDGGKTAEGIVLDSCATGTISGNNISKMSAGGIRVAGTAKTPSTVTIQNNSVSLAAGASGKADIRLGDYCKKCKVIGNILSDRKYSVSKTGSSGTVYKPRGTTISSATRKNATSLAAKWKTVAGVDGYQVQYADNSKFKNAKTATAKKAKTASKTIKKLLAAKRYFVRIRTYDTLTGSAKYSGWSVLAPALHSWAVGDFAGSATIDGKAFQASATVAANGTISGYLECPEETIPFSAAGYSSYNAKKSLYKATFSVAIGGKVQKCSMSVGKKTGNGEMAITGTGIKASLSKAN